MNSNVITFVAHVGGELHIDEFLHRACTPLILRYNFMGPQQALQPA